MQPRLGQVGMYIAHDRKHVEIEVRVWGARANGHPHVCLPHSNQSMPPIN